jgi:hypothetical protein
MMEVKTNEGKTVGKADLRKVQDHSPQGPRYGHLPEPEAQAEAGLNHFSFLLRETVRGKKSPEARFTARRAARKRNCREPPARAALSVRRSPAPTGLMFARHRQAHHFWRRYRSGGGSYTDARTHASDKYLEVFHIYGTYCRC